MGLDFVYPSHADVSNPTQASNAGTVYNDEGSELLQEMLVNIDWDSLDTDEEEEDVTAEGNAEPSFNDDPIDAFAEKIMDDDDDPSMDQQVEQLHLLILETRRPETSMQSFTRLTNQQPWIPFRKVNATTPKSPVDFEEEGLFNRLHKEYKRNVSPGTPRYGYRDFELAWNIEVAERYRKKMEDDNDDIVLINRKSYLQLQEHYDDILQSERMSRICDPNCNHLQQLNETMRETRQWVTTPTGRVAERIQYRVTGRPMPFGNPTTFNPSVTRHAVTAYNGTHQAVPWTLAAPPRAEDHSDDVLRNFNRRTWCLTCGFRKRDHQIEESFGTKCKRDYCANCMLLKKHDHPYGMGPRCRNKRRESSPYVYWYHK